MKAAYFFYLRKKSTPPWISIMYPKTRLYRSASKVIKTRN